MESYCIRHSELPETSRLFTDFLYQFERVAGFYAYDPADLATFARAAARRDYSAERRTRLVAVLRAQNGDAEMVERLARPETVVVAAGQQTGLFSGPAYTIYKALTAVRLAQWLSEQGIPAAPVFWLAAEDHDYAEVNHCWVFDSHGRPRRIEAGDVAADRRPAGAIPAAPILIGSLAEALRGLPFADEVTDLAAAAYPQGATFGSGFAALLRRLLGRLGLLCFDPLAPEARELMRPLLTRAAEAGQELVERALSRSRELKAAGYHAQVRLEPHSSLLFLLDGGRRLAIRREGEDYICAGHRFSPRELAARGADLSAGALLRPLVQDWVMPVAASVVGPAELAYLAQSEPLYRVLGISQPVWTPRASLTLLDERAARLMQRYRLQLRDFFHGEEALRERIASQLVPVAMRDLIAGRSAQIARALESIREGVTGFDPTLARAFDKSRRKILYQLSRIEGKVAREALRRDERAGRDAAWLCAQLYPHRHMQERFYSLMAFLARHGLDLVERLYKRLSPECRDHQVVVI